MWLWMWIVWKSTPACQREIAEIIGKEFPAFSDVTQQTIGNWADKKAKDFENLSPPDSRQHFDVWSFATADKDAGQQSYFGAVPLVPNVGLDRLWPNRLKRQAVGRQN
jgi:hypothetical protein